MKRAVSCASAIAALALMHLAHATFTVTPDPYVAPPPGGWIINDVDVTIVCDGLSTGPAYQQFVIHYELGSSSPSLGVITVKNTAADTVIRLFIDSNKSIQSVVRDPDSAGEVWIYSCNAAGDCGSFEDETRSGEVTVNRIHELRAGRNIWADVTALGSDVESGLPDIESLVVVGDNPLVQSDGALRGNVTANGEFATSKGIGTITVSRTIASADHEGIVIQSGADIDEITSGNLADVDITATGSLVGLLQTTTGGWGGDPEIPIGFPADGEFDPESADATPSGSLTCGRLDLLSLYNDLRSTITNTLVPHSYAVWSVGHSFTTSSGQINVPSNGLPHQISFNKRNAGGVWTTAQVYVNATALSNLYSPAPSTLGGGSAGLATYHMHGAGCNPEDDDDPIYVAPEGCPNDPNLCNTDVPNAGRDFATIRFYGPIFITGGVPVTVERRPTGGSTWTNVTSDFQFDVPTTGSGADAGERNLRLRLTATGCHRFFPIDYDYRVTGPVSTHLKSKSVGAGGSEPDVASFEYNFTLLVDCEDGLMARFDLNTDQAIDTGDLAVQLNEPRDLSGDEVTDSLDIEFMLDAIEYASNP